MSDSVSAYYDDLEEREARELAEKQRTVEYWRQRALVAEQTLRELKAATAVIEDFRGRRLDFDPVYDQ